MAVTPNELFAEVATKLAEAFHNIAAHVAERTGTTFDPEYLRKKTKKKKDVDPNAPKRPLSAYQLFCTEIRRESDQALDMKQVADLWKATSPDQKDFYENLAINLKKKYELEKAAYFGDKAAAAAESESDEDSDVPPPSPTPAKRKKSPSPVLAPAVAPAAASDSPKKSKKAKKDEVAATPATEDAPNKRKKATK